MVAGLSGSGKSTFMRALAQRRLPQDVLHFIPKMAGGWPHTSCKFLLEHGIGEIPGGDETPSGLVMHYNMSRPFALGLPDYRADKGLEFLYGLDAAIIVVTILTQREALIGHIRSRAVDAEWIAEEMADSPMLRRLRRQVRAAVCNRLGMPGLALKKGQLDLIRHYESPGNIEHWLENWEAFLEHLGKTRTSTRFVTVSPDPAPVGGPNFRLVETC